MIRTITKEWLITKTYVYEVVLQDGMISLGWDDFQTMASNGRPIIAVSVDGDVTIGELASDAMAEIKKHCSGSPSGIIVSVSCKKVEEIMMDEMFGLSDSMDNIASENIEIKWGICQNDGLESKRCVSVYFFA